MHVSRGRGVERTDSVVVFLVASVQMRRRQSQRTRGPRASLSLAGASAVSMPRFVWTRFRGREVQSPRYEEEALR
jgi:hypothetical protein